MIKRNKKEKGEKKINRKIEKGRKTKISRS
jgi:hypothetical protein